MLFLHELGIRRCTFDVKYRTCSNQVRSVTAGHSTLQSTFPDFSR